MLMSPSILEALTFAMVAHDGQYDRSGLPYILHPINVANQLETEEEMILGLLHDVVEDTEIPLSEIRLRFGDRIAEALDLLTKRPDEEYMDYIERVATDPLAIRIKLADLNHNMDPARHPHPDEWDKEHLDKYRKARERLLEAQKKND